METQYITIVDVGSYKTAVCTASVTGSNITIAAFKQAPSDGVTAGRVTNPKMASQVIGKLIGEIEEELGIHISRIVTGIPGVGIRNDIITITKRRSDPYEFITREELDQLTEEAFRTSIEDGVVYSAIPQSFRVGEICEVMLDDAIGMAGDEIEAVYKLFIGGKNSFDMNQIAFSRALNLEVAGKYLNSVAAAAATLTEQERQNGVAFIEFGGSTTNLLIYYKNIIRYAYSIPFGGNNITKDISVECKITERLAESIKRDYGYAIPEKLANYSEKSLQITSSSQRDIEVPMKYLSEIIEARCREIFDAILYHIELSGFADTITSGIVMTGGSANLNCVTDLLKQMSGYSVRRALPNGRYCSKGFNRLGDFSSSTMIGLLMLAAEYRVGYDDGKKLQEETKAPAQSGQGLFSDISEGGESGRQKEPEKDTRGKEEVKSENEGSRGFFTRIWKKGSSKTRVDLTKTLFDDNDNV